MTIFGQKRQTDVQIINDFWYFKKKNVILNEYGWRRVAQILKTSEGRLRRLFPAGLPGSAEKRAIKSDGMLIEESTKIINQKSGMGMTIAVLAKRLKTKPQRLLKVLPSSLKAKINLVCPLSAANKQRARSSKSLRHLAAILGVHYPEENKGSLLFCEVCKKNSFGPYGAKDVLTVDHIYGQNYHDKEHLRVLCRNCHGQTINCRRRTDLITVPDYKSGPDGTGVAYDKINMLHCAQSQDPGTYRYHERLKKQTAALGNAFEKKKASLEKKQTRHCVKASEFLDGLISCGYRRGCCESCGISEWRGFCIGPFLELHHKDGDNTNNAFCNLELLCPNCHSGRHTAEVQPALNTNKTLKSADAFYKAESITIEKQGSRSEDVQAACKVYAMLRAPNSPPTLSRCASIIGMHPERFNRYGKTFWPKLWENKKKNSKSTYWLGDPETRAKAKIVYDAAIDKTSPLYGQRSVARAVSLFGLPNNITTKNWLTLVQFLKDNYYVKKGLNPFHYLFSLENLELPAIMPPKEV